MASMGGGASAEAFLLPLILGISVLTFLVTAIVTLAPTEAELREDAALMERIGKLTERVERPSPLSAGGGRHATGTQAARPAN